MDAPTATAATGALGVEIDGTLFLDRRTCPVCHRQLAIKNWQPWRLHEAQTKVYCGKPCKDAAHLLRRYENAVALIGGTTE